jgi:hypothetical protein
LALELGLSVGDRVKFKMSVDAMKRNPTTPTIGPSASISKDGESPKGSPERSTESAMLPPPTKSTSAPVAVPVPAHKRSPSERRIY